MPSKLRPGRRQRTRSCRSAWWAWVGLGRSRARRQVFLFRRRSTSRKERERKRVGLAVECVQIIGAISSTMGNRAQVMDTEPSKCGRSSRGECFDLFFSLGEASVGVNVEADGVVCFVESSRVPPRIAKKVGRGEGARLMVAEMRRWERRYPKTPSPTKTWDEETRLREKKRADGVNWQWYFPSQG